MAEVKAGIRALGRYNKYYTISYKKNLKVYLLRYLDLIL